MARTSRTIRNLQRKVHQDTSRYEAKSSQCDAGSVGTKSSQNRTQAPPQPTQAPLGAGISLHPIPMRSEYPLNQICSQPAVSRRLAMCLPKAANQDPIDELINSGLGTLSTVNPQIKKTDPQYPGPERKPVDRSPPGSRAPFWRRRPLKSTFWTSNVQIWTSDPPNPIHMNYPDRFRHAAEFFDPNYVRLRPIGSKKR